MTCNQITGHGAVKGVFFPEPVLASPLGGDQGSPNGAIVTGNILSVNVKMQFLTLKQHRL